MPGDLPFKVTLFHTTLVDRDILPIMTKLSGVLHVYSLDAGALTIFESGDCSSTSCLLFIAGLTEVSPRLSTPVLVFKSMDMANRWAGLHGDPIHREVILRAGEHKLEFLSNPYEEQLSRLRHWQLTA